MQYSESLADLNLNNAEKTQSRILQTFGHRKEILNWPIDFQIPWECPFRGAFPLKFWSAPWQSLLFRTISYMYLRFALSAVSKIFTENSTQFFLGLLFNYLNITQISAKSFAKTCKIFHETVPLSNEWINSWECPIKQWRDTLMRLSHLAMNGYTQMRLSH